MAAFDDSADPELGAACSRLAAWVESLPEGKRIDRASGLTERDLALILRRLYETREYLPIPVLSMEEAAERYGQVPTPAAKKGPWG